jgi:hypothetical protein
MRISQIVLRAFYITVGPIVVGLSGLATAHAQQTPENKYDLKPLVPPMFTLPPNAQVKPGGVNPDANNPPPPVRSFEPPPTPGIKFSLPTR